MQSSIIKNSKNINWFGENFDKQAIVIDKNKAVYIYCKADGRSSKACAKLAELGFTTIYNLDGGMDSWKIAKKEITYKNYLFMITKNMIQFLADLTANNNKEWMHAHKKRYEEYKKEYHNFIGSVLIEMKKLDPNLSDLEIKIALSELIEILDLAKTNNHTKRIFHCGLLPINIVKMLRVIICIFSQIKVL